MRKIYILLLILCICFFGCSSEEPTYDKTGNNAEYLMYGGDSLYWFVSGTQKYSNMGYVDSFTQMRHFNGVTFAIMPEMKSINLYTVDVSLQICGVKTIKLENLTPIDICCPNATDGYVACDEYTVALLDLTNYNIASKKISLKGKPNCIAGAGNQVFVTEPNANLVEIIDTRINEVTKSIEIENPLFVDVSHNSEVAVIVSDKKITVWDIEKHTLITQSYIGGNETNAANLRPTGVTFAYSTAFVSAENRTNNTVNCVWKITSPTYKAITAVSKNSTLKIGYNMYSNVIYALETEPQTQLSHYDATNGRYIQSIPLHKNISSIAPIK